MRAWPQSSGEGTLNHEPCPRTVIKYVIPHLERAADNFHTVVLTSKSGTMLVDFLEVMSGG